MNCFFLLEVIWLLYSNVIFLHGRKLWTDHTLWRFWKYIWTYQNVKKSDHNFMVMKYWEPAALTVLMLLKAFKIFHRFFDALSFHLPNESNKLLVHACLNILKQVFDEVFINKWRGEAFLISSTYSILRAETKVALKVMMTFVIAETCWINHLPPQYEYFIVVAHCIFTIRNNEIIFVSTEMIIWDQ